MIFGVPLTPGRKLPGPPRARNREPPSRALRVLPFRRSPAAGCRRRGTSARGRRDGPIRLAKFHRLLARGLHQVNQHVAESLRNLAGGEKIDNEIAALLVDQGLELLLHRLALEDGGHIVAERDDDHVAHQFVLQRHRPGREFRHADRQQEVHDPAEDEQFPNVEHHGHSADGRHRGDDEDFNRILP